MAYTDFFKILASGSKGDAGLMVFRGAWSSGTTYAAGDGAQYDGRTFISLVGTNLNHAPPTYPTVANSYWSLVAEKGAASDFVGPSSSVDGDVVGFDGTSGKLGKTLGSPSTVFAAALTALSAITTAPVGSTHYAIVYNGSAWKKILLDDLAKGYMSVDLGPGMFQLPTTDPAKAVESVTMTGSGVKQLTGSFDPDVKTYYDLAFTLPSKYDGGAIGVRFVWFSDGATTSNIRMGAKMACAAVGASLDTSFGTAVEITDAAPGAAYYHAQTDTIYVTPSNAAAGIQRLMIRIYRDGTNAGEDLLDDTVYLLGVALDVPINKWSA